MKKIFTVLTLAALLPLLFSCNKENGDVVFDQPEFTQYACQLIPKSAEPALAPTRSTTAGASPLVSIELTESGLYVLGQLNNSLQVVYSSGRYTVSGKIYTLSGFGTLSFDNSVSGDVSVTVTPLGGVAQTILATLRKAATVNNPLCRNWTVDKTRVTVKGWTTASADFAGCNFHEIAEFLRKNGNKAPADVPENYGLKSISFTGTNTVIFFYTDDSLDKGEFSLSGTTVSYQWAGFPKGFTFVTDKATIEYLDGKCLFKIDAAIQNSTTSGSVTFVLSPAD